jgi:hypothetical protein
VWQRLLTLLMTPKPSGRMLIAWDSQGVHRTGTAGDEAGARWLAHEAAGFGVEVTTETSELDRLEPVACYLELDGERISAVPAFDAPPTDHAGLTGTLSLRGYDDAILVARLSPQSVYTGESGKLRRETPHRALMIACTGTCPGIGLLNAERFREPYSAPAIHVSSEATESRPCRCRTLRDRPHRRGKPTCSSGHPKPRHRNAWLPALLCQW